MPSAQHEAVHLLLAQALNHTLSMMGLTRLAQQDLTASIHLRRVTLLTSLGLEIQVAIGPL